MRNLIYVPAFVITYLVTGSFLWSIALGIWSILCITRIIYKFDRRYGLSPKDVDMDKLDTAQKLDVNAYFESKRRATPIPHEIVNKKKIK